MKLILHIIILAALTSFYSISALKCYNCTEKGFDDIVKLYLKGLLTFQREYDIDLVGPSNQHMVRFKWYVLTIDKSKTLKDIRSVIKAGKVA